MSAGSRRHHVWLDRPTTTADTEGGFTQVWTPLTPPDEWVSITPATARDLERTIANTVQSTATHVIGMKYRADVTTATRITKGTRNTDGTLTAGSREFQITGVQNVEERNRDLVLVCQEVVP